MRFVSVAGSILVHKTPLAEGQGVEPWLAAKPDSRFPGEYLTKLGQPSVKSTQFHTKTFAYGPLGMVTLLPQTRVVRLHSVLLTLTNEILQSGLHVTNAIHDLLGV